MKEDARQRALACRKEAIVINAENSNVKQLAQEQDRRERVEEEKNTVEIEDSMGVVEEDMGAAKVSASQKRNYMDLSCTAKTSMRFEMSVRSTAAVISAFLGDLISAGKISPSKSYLAVVPSKLQRARDKLLAEAGDRGDALTEEDTIRNIMFDSRLDQTNVRRYDEQTGRFYARVEIQDHYTLTDGEGRFLVHITKPKNIESKAVESRPQQWRIKIQMRR